MNDIQELMRRDPLELSKTPGALDQIIAEMRKMYAAYKAGNRKAGSTKKAPAKSFKETVDLDLGDIKL